jgi:hypothetical protein
VFFFVAALDGVEFFPVQNAAGRVTVGFFVALVVDEAAELFDRLICSITTLYSATEVL